MCGRAGVCVGFVTWVYCNTYTTTPTGSFPCFFLSCMSNARVKLAKTGHGPHSFKLQGDRDFLHSCLNINHPGHI